MVNEEDGQRSMSEGLVDSDLDYAYTITLIPDGKGLLATVDIRMTG